MRRLIALSVPAALLFASAPCFADIVLQAVLNNATENPPTVPTLTNGNPRPASFGTATFVLNDAKTSMTMLATINNIDVTGSQTADTNDNLTAAHIHAAATAGPGTNVGVVWGFFGSPFNDNNPNDFVLTPFTGGAVGGTFVGKWDAPEGNGTTLTAQLDNILSGHSYINFHTSQFGGGEIRGFLIVVPEPASLAALSLGSLALLARRRRSS